MTIEKLIEKTHANAKEKGFWKDAGENYKKDELLALAIGELSEAIEADRKNKYADRETFYKAIGADEFPWKRCFEMYIKDSREDELADAFIRLCDIAGGFGHSADKIDKAYHQELGNISHHEINRFSQSIFYIQKTITDVRFHPFPGRTIGEALAKIKHLADKIKCDLWWHIDQKMKYNSQREHMHGKNY